MFKLLFSFIFLIIDLILFPVWLLLKVVVVGLFIFYLSQSIARADDWVCKTQSSVSRGTRAVLTCGLGTATSEAEARAKAHLNALEEFNRTCRVSSDCSNNRVIVRPKRTECINKSGKVHCYRAVLFDITEEPASLDEELKRQRERLAQLREKESQKQKLEKAKMELKFSEKYPSYWSVGLGINTYGYKNNGLLIGYGLNFKYCIMDILCPTVQAEYGGVYSEDRVRLGSFAGIHTGASLYFFRELYLSGSMGVESIKGNKEKVTTLKVGYDAVRINNVSFSFDGGFRMKPNDKVRGTFSIFANVKF